MIQQEPSRPNYTDTRMQEESEMPWTNSVRRLDDLSSLEDQATIDRLEKLVVSARETSCLETLEKFGHNVSYLTDPSRMAYFDLLEFQENDDVLEIGSSMGQHTREIAKKCRQLSSIEVVLQQAEFQAVWLREDGVDNVDISAGGASGILPYPDSSFDLVICNYVLEGCAGRSTNSAVDFHRRYLKEVSRVLRPGGRLFLSTKNRFSIRYLMGSVDEALGIRFGSALPRILQRVARKRADLGHPTGYLHSWNGLEKILKDAGFRSADRILAFPDARYPHYIGAFDSFDRSSLPSSTLDGLSKKNKLSLYLGKRLFQFTSNSIVFIAKL